MQKQANAQRTNKKLRAMRVGLHAQINFAKGVAKAGAEACLTRLKSWRIKFARTKFLQINFLAMSLFPLSDGSAGAQRHNAAFT